MTSFVPLDHPARTAVAAATFCFTCMYYVFFLTYIGRSLLLLHTDDTIQADLEHDRVG